MCGISGIINLSKTQVLNPKLILDINDEMYLRGPDSEGFLFANDSFSDFANNVKQNRPKAFISTVKSERDVVFGHRRLSIIDLSVEASQPMSDVTERYWVVFNGEIYNFKEIRSELELLGFKFKTDHSDTEVLLNAYAAWGTDCLKKLRGMFAFVLWDKKQDLFFVVRDRLGVKPLFYAIHNNVFYFASELKALLKNKEISREIDYTSLSDYISFTSVPAPKTIFTSIKKMEAAHFFIIQNGSISNPVRYWSPISNKITSSSEDVIIDELLHHLETSIKYRTIADVPIGCLLSGGVDSSSNLAFMSKNTTEKINAFSVGFSNVNGNTNEFKYAKQVANLYDANYTEIVLNESHFINFIDDLISIQDEPIADTAGIPIYYIAKKAKENGISVLLGGEGSDELLLGYEHWRLMFDFYNKIKSTPFNSGKAAYKMLHSLPVLKNKRIFYKKWIKRIENNTPIFIGGTEFNDEFDKSILLSDHFKYQLNGYSSYNVIEKYFSDFKEQSIEERSYYDFMSYLDLNFRLPESLLARLDKMTMAASVEAREPFMDHVLTEFCMSIPAALKVKNNEDKYLLKKGMEKYLPNDILYRPKLGFPVPLNNMLFEKEWGTKISAQLNDFNNRLHLFDDKAVKKHLQEKNGSQIWNLLNLSSWLDKYQ